MCFEIQRCGGLAMLLAYFPQPLYTTYTKMTVGRYIVFDTQMIIEEASSQLPTVRTRYSDLKR